MNRELQKRVAAWRKETIALAAISEVRTVMFGGRTSRKERAPSNPSLKKPTELQVEVARRQQEKGWRVHEIEQHWAGRGVRITRNMLSRMKGALR